MSASTTPAKASRKRLTTKATLARVPGSDTTETVADRAALLSHEAYSIVTALELIETALHSDQVERLLERDVIQAGLCGLRERVSAVGEALEGLARDTQAVPGRTTQ
jgi:hypothetical protein